MLRTATRLGVAVAALGLVTLAVPANAAAPTYAPGDAVSMHGVTLIAPTPGNGVAISVDMLTGPSTTLVVSTDADGVVTVHDGVPAPKTSAPAAPNKCNDSAYSLINGSSWPGTYNWRFKASSTPNELTKKQATNGLKTSVNNITKSNNGCGLADQVSATNSYKGTTTASSDVTAGLQCLNPNGQNVTEFGPINTSGVLAATCTYWTGTNGDIYAASVRINTGFEWWVSGSCSSAIGLKATMTHEYGHAYGLSHVDEQNHGDLTMSTNINSACSNFEASLGKGDVLALRDLY
jgi:hypothetical protein